MEPLSRRPGDERRRPAGEIRPRPGRRAKTIAMHSCSRFARAKRDSMSFIRCLTPAASTSIPRVFIRWSIWSRSRPSLWSSPLPAGPAIRPRRSPASPMPMWKWPRPESRPAWPSNSPEKTLAAQAEDGGSQGNNQAPPAQQTESRPGGGLGPPIDAPDPLQKYRWWILGSFAAALIVGGIFIASRQQAANRNARSNASGLSDIEDDEDD